MLAKTISDNKKDWNLHIPWLMFAYRASTGYTPFHACTTPSELSTFKFAKVLRNLISTTKVGMISTWLTYISVLVIKYGYMFQPLKLALLRN